MAMGDFEDDREEPPFRDPLPLDDRLWRHPSELDGAEPAPASGIRRLMTRFRRSPR